MSIERIRNYIIENAQKEAEKIIKTAEEQFRTQVEAAKLSLEKQFQKMLNSEEERLKEDIKRTLNTLKRDYKMRLLEIKNRIIDDVLALAISRIQSSPEGDYLALIAKWLANVPDYLEGQLFFNARDLKRITDAFVDAINKNRRAKIVLNTTAIDIKGGFVIKSANYEIDYSLDTIMKNLRTVLAPKLGNILRLSNDES